MSLTEPRIIVFTCNWSAYSGLESAGAEGLSYPASVHPVRVMCLARLHPGLILRAFELGAAGVLLLGCPPGECHYGSGNSRAAEMFEELQALARLLGVRDEQLQLDWVTTGQGATFANKVREFADRLMLVPAT